MNSTVSRLSRGFQAGFCTTAFIVVSGFIGQQAGLTLNLSENMADQLIMGGFAFGIVCCATQHKGYIHLLSEAFDWNCSFRDNLASMVGISVGLKAGLIGGTLASMAPL